VVPPRESWREPPYISVDGIRTVPLDTVMSSEGNVMFFERSSIVRYTNDLFSVAILHNFGNTIAWFDDRGFVGIEPVTGRPLLRSDGLDSANRRIFCGLSCEYRALINVHLRTERTE
jgi:hypothetical protein